MTPVGFDHVLRFEPKQQAGPCPMRPGRLRGMLRWLAALLRGPGRTMEGSWVLLTTDQWSGTAEPPAEPPRLPARRDVDPQALTAWVSGVLNQPMVLVGGGVTREGGIGRRDRIERVPLYYVRPKVLFRGHLLGCSDLLDGCSDRPPFGAARRNP